MTRHYRTFKILNVVLKINHNNVLMAHAYNKVHVVIELSPSYEIMQESAVSRSTSAYVCKLVKMSKINININNKVPLNSFASFYFAQCTVPKRKYLVANTTRHKPV